MVTEPNMPRSSHTVHWSDREVSVINSPLPHILVGKEGSACSRLERYFDHQPPPRPAKPNGLLGTLKPAGITAKSKPISHLNKTLPVSPPKILVTSDDGTHEILNQAEDFVDGGACKTSTWTYKTYKKSTSNSEKARFRPDRYKRDPQPVQRLQWRDSDWQKGFTNVKDDYLDLETRPSAKPSSDMSPHFVIKKILHLFENNQYRDTAKYIQQLPKITFKAIIAELPLNILLDAMPHSLPILEVLYCTMVESVPLSLGSTSQLRPDAVVWQMVRFFAQQEECLTGDIRWEFCGPFVNSCKKILTVIAQSEPNIRKNLQLSRKQLEKAIGGMGHHGLVGTKDESLVSLHAALKQEFDKVVKSYTMALEKLEELSLSNKNHKSVSHGPAPIHSSHQRQLSITQDEVQQRLIKNKTLLNVCEPTIENHSLNVLLGILQRRIEYDKDVLFQFTQLCKEAKEVVGNAVVAPILMRYKHGCEQVLDMLREAIEEDRGILLEEDEESDVSGYHSDSDSAIMMSGNSPFISKNARFNFLTRSVRYSCNPRSGMRRSFPLAGSISTASSSTPIPSDSLTSTGQSSSSSGSNFNDNSSDRCCSGAASCTNQLRSSSSCTSSSSSSGVASDLSSSHHSHDNQHQQDSRESSSLRQEVETLRVEVTRARQTILLLQDQANLPSDRLNDRVCRLSRLEGLSEVGPSALVRRFGNLYAQARVDTLDALDNVPDLTNAEELKSKLLFSVVVLAFRSASASAGTMRSDIRRILKAPPPPEASTQHLKAHMAQLGQEYNHHAHTLECAVAAFITSNIDKHDLSKNIEEVSQQIWATLYDYPNLKSCLGLSQYIKNCVRLSWGLVNQTPPFVLDYEQRTYKRELHSRFHNSDPESGTIKTYLWPALLEGPGGPTVQKGIVIT